MQPTGVIENAKGTKNPLKELLSYGQSMWLDYIRRDLFTTGKLKHMIEEDGLRGMTSNPSIFEKAIGDSSLYDDILKSLAGRSDLTPTAKYEQIAIRDIQAAADTLLRPVYEQSNFHDGFVSLEVSPYLARKTQETIDEARRLWKTVSRENVMIKVPGTAEGIPAIRQLIGEGININVTLLFAQEVYEKVAEAYVAGLEDLAARGGNLKKEAGVASFFISRIDTLIDSMLNEKLKSAADGQKALLNSLLGKVAIANGKLTYQRYQQIFSGPRWEALAKKGAQTQRVLWASTSTKNPKYRDVIYVEELIGPDTVNTMPPATVDAFRDHGIVRNTLTEDTAGAKKVMDDLARAGISMKEVTDKLTDDGVKLFADAFDKLLAAVAKNT
jgi:transaldolase/glucose-6-phosphate isomerase